MKIMIGRIRSKFGGNVPTSGNASISLDGDTLIQEGREDMKQLKEDLERKRTDTDMEMA